MTTPKLHKMQQEIYEGMSDQKLWEEREKAREKVKEEKKLIDFTKDEKISVSAIADCVFIHFRRPITWIELDHDNAVRFAETILEKARNIKSKVILETDSILLTWDDDSY